MGKVDLPSMRQREKERVSIICLLVWVSGKKQVQSGKHSFKERERNEREGHWPSCVCVRHCRERATSSSWPANVPGCICGPKWFLNTVDAGLNWNLEKGYLIPDCRNVYRWVRSRANMFIAQWAATNSSLCVHYSIVIGHRGKEMKHVAEINDTLIWFLRIFRNFLKNLSLITQPCKYFILFRSIAFMSNF